MAPVKPPTKALKSMKKPVVEQPIAKSKKKKKSYRSFSIYIYKILKTLRMDVGISSKSMRIMDSFVNDMLEMIAGEAAKLVHMNHKTLGSREIQTASKLLLPGELYKHANIEGMKAISMYMNNKANANDKSS